MLGAATAHPFAPHPERRGLEQYSHECLNKSTEDAHLHAYLSSVSGSARALFESALEMVATHEGIALQENVQK